MIRTGLRRRAWARLPAVLGALSVLSAVLVWTTDSGGTAAAQAADLVEISYSKETDLVSGEAIEINVHPTEGNSLITGTGPGSEVRVCRDQESYQAADLLRSSGVCVHDVPLNNADASLESSPLSLFPPPAGWPAGESARGISFVRPGVGTSTRTFGGQEFSVTCDEDNPCRLVFRVHVRTSGGGTTTLIQPGIRLQFQPTDRLTGCDGVDPDTIASTMPDRLQDEWVAWTRDYCTSQSAPPPTGAHFDTEDEALYAFASGDSDIAYSGVSYRPGFDPAAPPTGLTPVAQRPLVPVPVGLNAVVVAVSGGCSTYLPGIEWPPGLARPHAEFRLTTAQAAELFGRDHFDLLYNRWSEVLGVNTQLPEVPDCIRNSTEDAGSPVALSFPRSTSLFASTFFDTLAPQQWVTPTGEDRAVEHDLGASVPAHDNLALGSGRPDMSKLAFRYRNENGGYYFLTDYASAQAMGLTLVTLQNAAGEWVTPTPETMAAAAGELVPQADGTLAPNPQATSGYPLTFVEYAMAPAEPLVSETCAARSGAQATLSDWLGYVTTDGQDELAAPGGLVPLTDALRTMASEARGRVGASPSTCVAAPGPGGPGPGPGAPGSSPDSSPGGSGGSGSGSRPGGSGGGGTTDAAALTQEATPESTRDALDEAEEAEVELPDLLGIRAANDLLPPLALVTIVMLTTGAVLATAGYPMPAAVARVPGQVRRLAGRVRARGVRFRARATAASGETP